MTPAGPLTAVSLFAGIGGFDLACWRAGIGVRAAVEIDPGCRSVLARHFPHTRVFDDVREVTGDQLRAAGFVPRRGVLTAGFPCQDLSVAGRRAGLGGARSGLFWHVMRLADELRPRWIVLENVPGLLSAVCTCPGDGTCTASGRAVRCGEWRTPAGAGRSFAAGVPHAVRGGACDGGCMRAHGGAMGTVLGALGQRGYGFCYRVLDAQFFGVPQRRERVFIAGCAGDPAGPVEVLLEPDSSGRHPAPRRPAQTEVAGTLGSRAGGGCSTELDRHGAYVVSTLQGGGRRGHRVDAESAAGGHLVTVPVAVRGRNGGSQVETGQPGDPAFTLRTPGGGGSYPMVAYSLNSHHGRNDLEETGVTHTLTAEGADAPEDGTGRSTPLVPVFAPLTAGTPAGAGVNPAGRRREDDWNLTAAGHAVRRLTPRECERLQGFPDDWTRWLADGSEQSDSARYRELGNAVAVPVATWITRRLAAEAARAVRSSIEGSTAA